MQDSVRGKWDGDIDLGDGKLQELRAGYDARIAEACIPENDVVRDVLEQKILKLVNSLQSDQTFLAEGLKEADSTFQKKFNSPNASQKLLKSLCWERVEYNTLLQQAQAFHASVEDLDPSSPAARESLHCRCGSLPEKSQTRLPKVSQEFVCEETTTSCHSHSGNFSV